ncbi:unnamed protein product [Chrysodeixis includens]|uniref:Uncharacterized protein n=1 Tax=Chrysodeixis includens TaxID=689277 RepID=A0A9P0C2E9_CHRIL|nr:unnamed protein product [Chrysodeixis includens]
MSRPNLRQRPRISYYEPEEPSLDEYIFCDQCSDFVYEYCALHGPLLVIPDDKVPAKTNFPSFVPRAALTIPHVFLHLAPSIIPGAGLGVFSTLTLPRGVRFGPYRGQRTQDVDSMYCWQIYDRNHKPSHVVNAADSNRSNWMRYVNCARHWCEQNLLAYQYQGELYYRTIKTIPRFTELMVFYGSEFANTLHINLSKYNSPPGYAQKFGVPVAKKPKIDTHKQKIEDTSIIKSNNIKKVDERKKTDLKAKPSKLKPPTNIAKKNVMKTKSTNINTKSSTLDAQICNDTNNNDSNFRCKSCNFIGISDEDVKKHNLSHINGILSLNKNNSNGHIVNASKKPYKCDTCHKCFNRKPYLDTHICIHTGEKPYKCDICQKCFHQKPNLDTHIHIHTGEKPYKCDICQKCFNQKPNLDRHIRIHTGEKPYKCDICQKCFNQKPNLDTHIRIHTGEKPYKCDICQKCFNHKPYLVTHIRIHTGEKPYKCDICQKCFSNKSHLVTHIRIHTGEKPYKCDICQKCFSDKSNLRYHIRKDACIKR